jgi:hypothetical protein
MRPSALEIRLILSAPSMGWEYVARKNGEAIAASDGVAFDQPGRALMACVAEMKAYAAVPPAPTLDDDGGDDGDE